MDQRAIDPSLLQSLSNEAGPSATDVVAASDPAAEPSSGRNKSLAQQISAELDKHAEYDDVSIRAAVLRAVVDGFPTQQCEAMYLVIAEIEGTDLDNIQCLLDDYRARVGLGSSSRGNRSESSYNLEGSKQRRQSPGVEVPRQDSSNYFTCDAILALEFILKNPVFYLQCKDADKKAQRGEQSEATLDNAEVGLVAPSDESGPGIQVGVTGPIGNFFGHAPNIPIGFLLATRKEVTSSGLHRRPMGSVHGKAAEGCYSILITGGYKEDCAQGNSIVFTGVGGSHGSLSTKLRKPGSALSIDGLTGPLPLNTENRALSRSMETQQPIRVIISEKFDVPYKPKKGFIYLGLFKVGEKREDPNSAGHNILRFRLDPYDDETDAFITSLQAQK
ncbi:hypothetical protein TWF694_011131 [Orbilia ellipsospora]|uniref:YDG domain-containing protein n=1 Tax=Orbilia ellipsospora TaxID=2528407 RepID=A0AAV9XB64_9PEZI